MAHMLKKKLKRLKQPINLNSGDLITSNSLFNSSVNEYLTKINTLQYLQNNDPHLGYQITVPEDGDNYIANNFTSKGQLEIDIGQGSHGHSDDFSKLINI